MRADRYDLQVPLRYRCLGDQAWSTGVTANISRSGVLFQAETALGIDTEIELGISLSMMTAGADIVGRARVVRMEVSEAEPVPMLAAEFSKYRFEQVPA